MITTKHNPFERAEAGCGYSLRCDRSPNISATCGSEYREDAVSLVRGDCNALLQPLKALESCKIRDSFVTCANAVVSARQLLSVTPSSTWRAELICQCLGQEAKAQAAAKSSNSLQDIRSNSYRRQLVYTGKPYQVLKPKLRCAAACKSSQASQNAGA